MLTPPPPFPPAQAPPPPPAGAGDRAPGAWPWGVQLIVRGCGHAEDDHGWPPSASCPLCAWQPEARSLVAATLASGLVALSVAPAGSCPDAASDAPLVAAALTKLFFRLRGADRLPVFATGAASGARAVARLHAHLPPPLRLAAVAPAFGCVTPGELTAQPGPSPTLWVLSPADGSNAACVAKAVAALRSAGRVAETLAVGPPSVGPAFFCDRIPGVDPAASAAAHAALRAAGLLGAGDLLTESPHGWADRGGEAPAAAWAAAAPALLRASADEPPAARFDGATHAHSELAAAFGQRLGAADAQPAVAAFFRRFAARA